MEYVIQNLDILMQQTSHFFKKISVWESPKLKRVKTEKIRCGELTENDTEGLKRTVRT